MDIKKNNPLIPANYRAFLDMLAYSEGTDHPNQKSSFNGYDVIVGGGTFKCFDDHPRIVVTVRPGLRSSAAGRYQFIRSTWDALKKRLKLPDFGPISQDRACLELLRECGALNCLDRNDLAGAIRSARRIWASLPGAGYGQREEKLAVLQKKFTDAGGRVA